MLKNRVYEISVADLMNDPDQTHQLVKLRVEDVKSKNAYTTFYGLRFTTDKLRSLVKKWHTLINAVVDVRTPDGYTLRMFAIGITKRRTLQVRKTTYAYHSQVLRIVARMKDIMQKTASSSEIKTLVEKLIFNGIGKDMEKSCAAIFPLQNVYVAKVKVLKAPKTDLNKLAELHQSTYNTTA
jgi:small subunit ribosomal protein S3Ae